MPLHTRRTERRILRRVLIALGVLIALLLVAYRVFVSMVHVDAPETPDSALATHLEGERIVIGKSWMARRGKIWEVHLKGDPFERAQVDAGEYARWRVEHAFALVPAQAYVAKHLATYQQFPPRQKPGSFALDQVLQKLKEHGGGAR